MTSARSRRDGRPRTRPCRAGQRAASGRGAAGRPRARGPARPGRPRRCQRRLLHRPGRAGAGPGGRVGSGKTTVVLALLGHARRGLCISSGAVLVDGVDLLRLPASQLRAVRGARVAYVPQDPSAALNPALRVGTQLTEAIRVHPGAVDDPDGRIREVLQEARLDASPELLRRYPHQLSGGQQQRVSLAMAFACSRPSLIVLDEPTTGLDVSTQRHVLDTIRSLCAAYGVAAVYVSHDLAVVGGLVSDVAVMYSGRIIEIGPTARVFGDPLHPYSRGLLSAVPSPVQATKLTGIDGQPPRPGHRPAGCAFAPRCGFATTDCRSQQPEPVLIDSRDVRCLRVAQVRESSAGAAAAVSPAAAAAAAPVLSLRDVGRLRAQAGARRRGSRRARGVVRRRGRRVRLGKDHPCPLHRRAAPQLDRRHHVRGGTPEDQCERPAAAGAAAGAYVFPEPLYLAQPAEDRRADRRAAAGGVPAAGLPEAVAARCPGAGGCVAGRGLPRQVPRPAVRRGAPAGRHRPPWSSNPTCWSATR